MAYELTEFTRPAGNFPPGMADIIYIALKSDVLTFPEPVSTSSGKGNTVKLDGDITFATSKGFVKCYATKDTVEATLQRIGQKDSRGWNAEIEFFVPGINAAWIELLNEDPELIMLVKAPDCDVDEWLCLGDLCRSMELDGEFASGSAGDESGRFGWTNTAKGFLSTPRIYTGTVTIAGQGGGGGG